MTKDQQVEILCSCLADTIPAAKSYGNFLRSRIQNVEEKAALFCTLVQTCSRTDQTLTKNEMLVEGADCIRWIISKLRSWDKTITIKLVCDSITLLEGKTEEDYPGYGGRITIKNKYPRVQLQTA
jgi:hypothetical protein